MDLYYDQIGGPRMCLEDQENVQGWLAQDWANIEAFHTNFQSNLFTMNDKDMILFSWPKSLSYKYTLHSDQKYTCKLPQKPLANSQNFQRIRENTNPTLQPLWRNFELHIIFLKLPGVDTGPYPSQINLRTFPCMNFG